MAVPARVTPKTLNEYYPRRQWMTRVQPVPDYGCVFVKNAKAGTSTVLHWLNRIHDEQSDGPADGGGSRQGNLPLPEQVGARRVARMLNGMAYRFTFVRDPLRRFESAYTSKIVRAADGQLGRRVALQRTLGLPENRDAVPTFDQFVAALGAKDPIRTDPHWRPQHLNLMLPLVGYDLIGRLESFDADLARVREATGLPDVPIHVRNRSRRTDGSLFDGRPDLVRKVRDYYAEDYELFGY